MFEQYYLSINGTLTGTTYFQVKVELRKMVIKEYSIFFKYQN